LMINITFLLNEEGCQAVFLEIGSKGATFMLRSARLPHPTAMRFKEERDTRGPAAGSTCVPML
jgi:hypothetical protein